MQLLNKIISNLFISDFVKDQIEILQKKISPQDLVTQPNSNMLKVIDAIKYYSVSDELLKYFLNLLEKTMNTKYYKVVHPSYIETLKNLSIDQIEILKKLRAQKYSFIRKTDLVERRWANPVWEKYEFPKNELSNPENFENNAEFMRARFRLIDWPIYKQEPILDGSIQTGLMEYSELLLTKWGVDFINNILENEN